MLQFVKHLRPFVFQAGPGHFRPFWGPHVYQMFTRNYAGAGSALDARASSRVACSSARAISPASFP